MSVRLPPGIAAVLALSLGPPRSVAAQASGGSWIDRAADYSVLPNIVFDLKLDLYLPPNIQSPVPVVMVIHGGDEGEVTGAARHPERSEGSVSSQAVLRKGSLGPLALGTTRGVGRPMVTESSAWHPPNMR